MFLFEKFNDKFTIFTDKSVTFFGLLLFLCLNILIPLGGLAAVLLIGWRYGIKQGIAHLKEGAEKLFQNIPILETYFWVSIKYIAPIVIILIMLDALGIF